MFSGIVEAVGTVVAIEPVAGAQRLTIRSEKIAPDLGMGDSISTQGVCLTVVDHDPQTFSVEAIPETLRLTTLGELKVGDGVNLERSLSLQTRLSGHLVFGHIDGVGIRLDGPPEEFPARSPGDDEVIHWYSLPEGLRRYLAPKGSIGVQGVSLTVVEVADQAFSVALIPHTLEVTTLGELKVGGRVNLEADMIAKYVAEQLRPFMEMLRTAAGQSEGAAS
jgi:riboflavin synthase